MTDGRVAHIGAEKLSAGKRLQRLIDRDGLVVAPGASDPLTAILIAEQGFEAAYCTGGGVSRSRGLPDIGYTTLSELVERVANITETCPLPVIVDADAGFGTALSVQRTVRLLERAGAAGVHIEDEEIPPRSASQERSFFAFEEMIGRIRAAADAREDEAFFIIGRTDVLPSMGIGAAIERANAFFDAGADMAYVEFLRSRRDLDAVAKGVRGPKFINQIKGETAIVPKAELADMGFKIVIHPADAQLAAIYATREVLKHLKANGSALGYEAMVSFEERDRIVSTDEHHAKLAKYLSGSKT